MSGSWGGGGGSNSSLGGWKYQNTFNNAANSVASGASNVGHAAETAVSNTNNYVATVASNIGTSNAAQSFGMYAKPESATNMVDPAHIVTAAAKATEKSSAQAASATKAEMQKRNLSSGRKATILTSSGGLGVPAVVNKKTLLGQ